VFCRHHEQLVELHGEDAVREGRYPKTRSPRSEIPVVLLREGLGRPGQAEEPPVTQLPDSVETVKQMSWSDLQAVVALQFADDIATVTAGEGGLVIRERLAGVGARGRRLLRETLDDLEASSSG
jgi:hypothetical protein